MINENKNILLIEDNPADARLIREIFSSPDFNKYDLHWVENLRDANAFLQTNETTVVLSDLTLPESSGIDTVKPILDSFPDIPVIVLTGINDVALATALVKLGAEDFLSKPRLNDYTLARAIAYAIERKKNKLQLAKREASYKRFFDEDLAGNFSATSLGEILTCNKAFVNLFGFRSYDDCIGKNIFDFFWVPIDRQNYLAELIKEKKLKRVQETFRKADGNSVITLGNYIGHFDANGALTEFTGYLIDITSEINFHEELIESEVRYRSLIENAPTAIAISRNYKFVYANPLFVKMFGYASLVDLLDKPLSIAVSPQNLEEFETRAKKREEGEKVDAEYDIIALKKDGSEFYVHASVTKIHLPEGPAILGFFTDITERKKTEKLLHDQTKLLTNVISSLPVGLWIMDKHGNIIHGNPEGQKIWAGAKYVGIEQFGDYKGWWLSTGELIKPDEWAAARAITKKETSINEEIEIQCFDGTRKIVLNSALPILDSENEVHSAIIINVDITELKNAEASLKISAEKYRTIFNNVQDIFYRTDVNGSLIEVSPSIEKHSGYKPEEVLNQHASIFYSDLADREKIIHLLHEYGELNDFETRMKTKSGENVFVSMSSHFIYDEKKNIVGIEGVLRNINNRKKMQAALIESENQFRTLSETTSSAIFMFGSEKMIYANPASEALSGYSNSELLEMNFWQIIHPDFVEIVKQRGIARLRGESVPIRYELKIIRKNGEERWVDFSAGVINYKGSPIVLGTAFDVTNRKTAELSLAESESKFRTLSETASSAIFIYKGEKFVYTNPAGESITGYKADELYETNFWDVVHPDHREMIRERGLARQRGEDVPNRYEFKVLRKDGTTCWVDFTSGLISFKGEMAALGTAFDITERKQAEEALKESEKRYREVVEEAVENIFTTDGNGYFTYANPAALKLSGYSLEELKKYRFSDLVIPEYKKLVAITYYRQFLERESVTYTEYPFLTKSGEEKWFGQNGRLIVENDEVKGFHIIARDITERRIVEIENRKLSTAVKQSEKKYKKFFDDDLSGNFKSTPDGKILMCNNSFVQILGYNTVEEVLQMNASHLYSERKDREKFLEELKEKKRLEGYETTLVGRDGKLIHVVENVIGVFDSNGEVIEIVGYLMDVTERKKAEAQLIQSEARYRQLFEANPQPMWVYDIKTLKFLAVNGAAIEHYGYSYEEFLGMTIKDIRPKEDIPKLLESINNFDGVDHAGVWRHIKKDGTLIYVEIISHNMLFDEREADLILATDISEKIKSQEELQKLSQAVEQASASVIITDVDGIIEYANPFFTKLTGYELKEVTGKNSRILKTGFHKDELYNELWDTIISGKIWRGELFNKKKNGDTYWAMSVISPIFNKRGDITHFVAIEEDITEKKKLLEDLIQAKDKAEEMNRVKSYFFANMSHELRTPFVGILGFAELLYDIMSDESEKEMVEKIIFSARRMQDTLTKILEVTDLEFSEVKSFDAEIDVKSVVEKVYTTFLPAAVKKNIKLRMNLDFDSLIINCDESLLVGVLNNLVDNSIKYTEQGSIKIEGNILGDEQLQIKVTDTGIGIPDNKHELIFTEFRQVSEGLNRAFEGTGLGLTIAQRFAKLLGGEILVESEVERGSTFTLVIPFIKKNKEKSLASQEVKEKTGGLSGRKRSAKKVLYVEDDPLHADVVKLYLSRYFSIDVAGSADHSLIKIKEKKYNLILLDINLGIGMSGVELLHFLNKDDHYKNVPKIAVTAYANKGDEEYYRSIGMNGYISKPFRLKELFKVVNEQLKN